MSHNAALFQLGGLEGTLHRRKFHEYDMDNTCRLVFGALSQDVKFLAQGDPSPIGVELILGILSNGASYVLLDHNQMDRVMRNAGRELCPAGKPKSPGSFASLSPIHFATADDLILKINSNTQKAKKKNKRDQEPRDNSKANGAYSGSTVQSRRPEFEHNRILSKIINEKYAPERFFLQLKDLSWLEHATVITIVANVWIRGEVQPRQDTLRDPELLDIAWVEVPLKSVFGDFAGQETSLRHISVQERRFLNNTGWRRSESRHMPTEIKKREDMLHDLKEFWEKRRSSHVFFVLQNRDIVFAVLKAAGVNLPPLNEGLHGLLAPIPTYVDGRYGRHDYRSKGNRHSRSRSPQRDYRRSGSYDTRVVKRRSASPPPRKSVFIVDVDELYATLDNVKRIDKFNVQDVAQSLGVDVERGRLCAGDDCYTIIKSWVTMASGLPIDEQATQRGFGSVAVKAEERPGEMPNESQSRGQASNPTESDEDYDPNDVDDGPPRGQVFKGPVPQTANANANEEYSEDDDYFDW